MDGDELGTDNRLNSRLLDRLSADFAAILIGYNLPRSDARRVAQQAVAPVQQYLASSETVFRLVRLEDRSS